MLMAILNIEIIISYSLIAIICPSFGNFYACDDFVINENCYKHFRKLRHILHRENSQLIRHIQHNNNNNYQIQYVNRSKIKIRKLFLIIE
ncbi:hypothetical protein BLA29_009984 [Euroglyphus maynei]|uniref:Uncharacterized protein n=1 Tax=Euroglyphus maynei TaxID=6958 RepID=A0A1Y3BFC2_EURMA|nr:hypothetical protein BLA29_009984 [Euroglyphus maynei]